MKNLLRECGVRQNKQTNKGENNGRTRHTHRGYGM